MGANWNRFVVLLWKNFKIQKKRPFLICGTTFLPILFSFGMLMVHKNTKLTIYKAPTSWPAQSPDLCLNGSQRNSTYSSTYCTYPHMSVFYTPDVNISRKVMSLLNGSVHNISVRGFSTEEDMVEQIRRDCKDGDKCMITGGIVFTNLPTDGETLPLNIQYKIRVHGRSQQGEVNRTHLLFHSKNTSAPRNFERGDYFETGFLFLQHSIDAGIMKALNPSLNASKFDVLMRRFPYRPYEMTDSMLSITRKKELILKVAVWFTVFVYSVLLARDIAYDKETMLKDILCLMGFDTWLQWFARFVEYSMLMFIPVVISTVITCYPVKMNDVETYGNETVGPYYRPLVDNIDLFLLFFFVIIFVFASIAMTFSVNVFICNANRATAITAGVVILFGNIPLSNFQDIIHVKSTAAIRRTFINYFTAMHHGYFVIREYTIAGTKLDWPSKSTSIVPTTENITFFQVLAMIVFDVFLYMSIAFYIDAVMSGYYMISKPWNFLCLPSYWLGVCRNKPGADETMLDGIPDIKLSPIRSFFENLTENDKPGIELRQLTKVFCTGSDQTTAVDNITITFCEGTITVLLGPNGAGKTAIVHMLTGVYPPTSGTATLYDKDIRTDRKDIIPMLGLCPQFNILHGNLTVEEHVFFFAKLRHCKSADIREEVDTLLREMSLEEYRKARVATLTQDTQRKVAIILAIVGGPKVIILDQPTSGLDPEARRRTWSLLKKYRKGRTIILITQHMEEADNVGDRIMIMVDGRIECNGTPMFLRRKFGLGYYLVITKLANCDVNDVTDLITTCVKTAYLDTRVGSEISYTLHNDCSKSFPQLFEELEKHKHDLKIESYVVTEMTMGEVFTRATTMALNRHSTHSSMYAGYSAIKSRESDPKLPVFPGTRLARQQLYAMFIKRLLHVWRRPFTMIVVMFVVAVFYLFVHIITEERSPSLNINLTIFDSSTVIYGVGDNTYNISTMLAESYKRQFKGFSHELVNVNDGVRDYLGDRAGANNYTYNYIVAAMFESVSADEVKCTAWFNYEAYHTAAISLNLIDNALLQHYIGPGYSIQTTNHMIAYEANKETAMQAHIKQQTKLTIALIRAVVFSFPMIIDSCAIYMIAERISSSKHLQIMSGVHVTTFWLSNFLFDFGFYLIPTAVVYVIFATQHISCYIDGSNLICSITLFVMFGWATLPVVYLASLVFSWSGLGVTILLLYTFLTGDISQRDFVYRYIIIIN